MHPNPASIAKARNLTRQFRMTGIETKPSAMKTLDLITISPAVFPPQEALASRVRHQANPAFFPQAWRWVRMGWLAMPLAILAG
jgi:hypothetical protein